MALRESQNTLGIWSPRSNSLTIFYNQIASFMASVKTTYSTSVVDKVIMCWIFDFQLIISPHIVKTYPHRDLFLSKSTAKLESQ